MQVKKWVLRNRGFGLALLQGFVLKKGMEDFENVSLSIACFEADLNLNGFLNVQN